MHNNTAQQTWLVTSWEFMHFFKWKQEVISKLIMLAIALLVMLWQYVKDDLETVHKVAVVSSISVTSQSSEFAFTSTDKSLETLKSEMREQQLWDAIIIESAGEDDVKQLAIYSQDKQSWQQTLGQSLIQQYTLAYATSLGLAPHQLNTLSHPAKINSHYLDESVKTDDNSATATAIGMIMLIAVGVFTSFGQLFVSITGEKQQRVTEQLYSCISPQTWIDGKIFGQMLHAIKAIISTIISIMLGYAFFAVVINGGTFDLNLVDWSMLPWLAIFSIIGVYFCTAFMASIAAAIDDPNHSAKTSIMLLPLVPIVLTFITMDSPSGWALTFLSFFPITSFAAMPVKMSLIDVPLWHVGISILLSLSLCIWIRTAAARLFKMGMTMYGKEPSVKQMIAWAFNRQNS